VSTAERGYGQVHRKMRERYRPVVEAGEAICARCFIPIAPPGEPCPRCGRPTAKGRPSPGMCGWDTGHDDVDRSLHTGTEHSCCNRKAGGRNGGKASARNARAKSWSRQWLPD
jgi:hypothetical protein